MNLIHLIAALTILAVPAQSQLLRKEGAGDSSRRGLGRDELNAKNIIDNAEEAFRVGQDERGIKALEQVAKQYPNARARFRAFLLLGEHHMGKRRYEEAAVELRKVLPSEEDTQVSRALSMIGICDYEQNEFDKAVSSLRQVINNFPGSSAANDAYYYIGLCHYHRKRWGKAMQAFEMVGTAVADREDEGEILAEAGRRLFIRVRDMDLPVLARLGHNLQVEVAASSGDREQTTLEPVGRSREDFVASIRTNTASSEPGDGILRIRGGDTVTVTYKDENTLEGEADVRRLATVRLVSTAGLAITDGAYRQTVSAVALEQPVFLRLKDLDLDTTPEVDEVRLEVVSRFKVADEEADVGEGDARRGVDLRDDSERVTWTDRAHSYVTLVESAPTSGLFLGRFTPYVLGGDEEKAPAGKLAIRPGDTATVRYTDARHLGGEDPVTLHADTIVVETGRPEVENMVSVSSNPEIQTRKLLLEAELRQMLAEIFQDMGLLDRATEKADTGLLRTEEILKMHAVNPLPRELVEKAFEASWNLSLAKSDVTSAIATCKSLLELYPDSPLADRAFLKIGQAYHDSDDPDKVDKAIPVLRMVMAMENSPSRAEASYLIGLVYERQAGYREGGQSSKEAQRGIAQFMSCAEQFPDSPFAADALKKVIKYYYDNRDYPRASELLERICQDYQDQDWLHKMLLTWGVVHLQMNQRELGLEKLNQVIEEYPESDSAVTANKLIGKLMGEAAGETEGEAGAGETGGAEGE